VPADEASAELSTEPGASGRVRVVVMGSTPFVLPSLDRLLGSPDHEVVAVYTRPPAAKGRGQQMRRTEVHERAEALGIPVETPARFREEGAVERFAAYRPDIVVTGAYGLILPKAVLDIPRFGCINLHASLLPRWRGAAPIERAILAGDTVTGICLFRMETGLDTGPVYARGEQPIGPRTTAEELHRSLALLAAELLLPTLAGIVDGSLIPVPQPEAGVTYAEKLQRDEGRLDFARPAAVLERMVRALEPRPGAFAMLNGERIAVRAASVVEGGGEPGEVVAAPVVVACGENALRLDVLQRPGKKAMPAQDLLRGWPVPVGTRFDPT
jgi:methionyl-tRNA formyltransferase